MHKPAPLLVVFGWFDHLVSCGQCLWRWPFRLYLCSSLAHSLSLSISLFLSLSLSLSLSDFLCAVAQKLQLILQQLPVDKPRILPITSRSRFMIAFSSRMHRQRTFTALWCHTRRKRRHSKGLALPVFQKSLALLSLSCSRLRKVMLKSWMYWQSTTLGRWSLV